ncbi:BON domain-containing protein [Archangium violaceum]|uniref:BON domain-containing protein n=1 Tax=Archangium violaceum TaxID=83451 RepID=UPI0019501436|nr:BON domain-containing protein [Archangium violaceum]QRN94377.1 BON domain-containing protein [Archangium violaceum]
MANRDYEMRRYLGDDRERWAGREREFDEGFRGSDMGPRQERGPWQGSQGYWGSSRKSEDYGRDYDQDRGYNLQGNYNPGNYNPPGFYNSQGHSGGGYSERDLGYDRGYGTYVARDRNEGLYGRRDYRDFNERGPLERLGDRFREGLRKLGKGPKAYTRSDDRIREDIYDRLMHGWVNAEHVEVQVKNGEVTLTGLVEERRDKRTIEDIIDDVLGVKDVHNQLKVGSPEQFNTTTGASGTSVTKVVRS